MLRLQNKFLFYDGTCYENKTQFITIEVKNNIDEDERLCVSDRDLIRDGENFLLETSCALEPFNIVCRHKDGRFLWKTNTVSINYEEEHPELKDISEKLRGLESVFDVNEIREAMRELKNQIDELEGRIDDENSITILVDNFNNLANRLSSEISSAKRASESVDGRVETYLMTYSDSMLKQISEIREEVKKIPKDNPFDIDMGTHDVPVGYFVSFTDGLIEKYKFGTKLPFGVVLKDKKIRVKGYCPVIHDGSVEVGGLAMGDENGMASKYSKGFPVIKMIDETHCGIIL